MRKWLVVILLGFGMVIAYVDRADLSTVLAFPDFKALFHLTDNDRGLLNSAFFWSYAALQIPAGWIVDRYGPKRPYAICFALWSLASAASGFVQSIGQLAAARLALGIGESVSTAASLRWIRFNCIERERGLATGILFAGTKVGAAVGAPVTVFLVSRFNWRIMFFISGAGGLVWLAAWLFCVPDQRPPVTQTAALPDIKMSDLLRRRPIWGIVLGTFAYNYFIYFCLTWLPSYFTEARHLSPRAMGFYTMFSFGGMAIVSVLAGWAADRVIARGAPPVRIRKAFTLVGLLFASTEIVGILTPSNNVALFFAIFSLTGLGLATANYWALTQTIFPESVIGRIIGVQNCASNLSGIAAAILTGWLKQSTGGYGAAGIAILGVLFIGLVSYGLLVREDPLTALTPSPQ
jgi:MFS transporter, ACS family, D-galactonate transporter